jgi:hypothetical protein
MLARSSTAGLLVALTLWLPADPPAPHFTLESTGALRLAVTGEATYGLVPEPVNGRPVAGISLTGADTGSVLLLYTYADEAIGPGRYPVGPSLPDHPLAPRRFHPCFVVGTAERPQGFFHGEAGWVTITAVEGGRIAGEYEIRARGFLAADPEDEEQWVTVRGTFSADGDSTAAAIRTSSLVAR